MQTEASLAIPFANSRYAIRGRPQEGIGTVEDLSTWLRDHATALGLNAATHDVDIRDVDTFVALRDAIRAVFGACVGGEPPPPESLGVINSAARAAPYWPVLGASYELEELTAGDALDAALAAIARDAMHLLAGPHRADLRACLAPGCVKFFLKDHPRRAWCCDHCGNRARAARHYRRHRPPLGVPWIIGESPVPAAELPLPAVELSARAGELPEPAGRRPRSRRDRVNIRETGTSQEPS